MVIVELKEMETSSGIYEEEDNIQIDFGEGTEASTEIFPNFMKQYCIKTHLPYLFDEFFTK